MQVSDGSTNFDSGETGANSSGKKKHHRHHHHHHRPVVTELCDEAELLQVQQQAIDSWTADLDGTENEDVTAEFHQKKSSKKKRQFRDDGNDTTILDSSSIVTGDDSDAAFVKRKKHHKRQTSKLHVRTNNGTVDPDVSATLHFVNFLCLSDISPT